MAKVMRKIEKGGVIILNLDLSESVSTELASLKNKLNALDTVKNLNPELESDLMKTLGHLEIRVRYRDFDLKFLLEKTPE